MTDQMAGTWKLDVSQTKGYEEFMEALGVSRENIDKMRDLESTVINEKDGDGWKSTMTAGTYTEIVKWKLNEEYEATTILGDKTKSTPVLDGDDLVETHKINTSGGDKEIQIRTAIAGNQMTSTMQSCGKTMSQVLIKS